MTDRWRKTEERIKEALEEVDGSAHLTIGSGNKKSDGDVKSKNFLAECKYRSKKNFIIQRDWVNKTKEEAEINRKIPLICVENSEGELLVAIPLEDFQHMMMQWRSNGDSSRHREKGKIKES